MNETQPMDHDPVNHPSHYTSHPSGVECITVTEHMSFNLGNAIKYLWRAGRKGAQLQDLEKARWYVEREIKRLAPKEVKQGEVEKGQPEPEPATAGSPSTGRFISVGKVGARNSGSAVLCVSCLRVHEPAFVGHKCPCGATL